MPVDLPTLTVTDVNAWRQWLSQNYAQRGVLVTIMVKAGAVSPTSLTYPQALDEALCYGWIDSGGHKRPDLPGFHYFRFTPRKPKGLWSQRNVGYVERLLKEGRMQQPGLAAVEAAREDGRWKAAYAGSATAEPPADFMKALDGCPKAKATWEGLNRGNRWAIYFRLLNLKTHAGREKCIRTFVDMLARGETPKPQKRRASKTNVVVKSSSSNKNSDSSASTSSAVSISEDATRRTRSGRTMPFYGEGAGS